MKSALFSDLLPGEYCSNFLTGVFVKIHPVEILSGAHAIIANALCIQDCMPTQITGRAHVIVEDIVPLEDGLYTGTYFASHRYEKMTKIPLITVSGLSLITVRPAYFFKNGLQADVVLAGPWSLMSYKSLAAKK